MASACAFIKTLGWWELLASAGASGSTLQSLEEILHSLWLFGCEIKNLHVDHWLCRPPHFYLLARIEEFVMKCSPFLECCAAAQPAGQGAGVGQGAHGQGAGARSTAGRAGGCTLLLSAAASLALATPRAVCGCCEGVTSCNSVCVW